MTSGGTIDEILRISYPIRYGGLVRVTRDNNWYNLVNAVAGAISINLINSYVGIYAVKLGATDLQLGYLSSWPQVMSVIAVLGAAAAVARSRSKQRLIAAIFLLGRAAALGAAAVPYFPQSWRVWALIAFWVLAVFPNSAGSTAQQSFLADVFPEGERARAFAARNSWATAAGMVTVLGSGWLLDHVFGYPVGYQAAFVASFAFGLWEIIAFMKLKGPDQAASPAQEPAEANPSGPAGLAAYWHTLRHRPFRHFLLCSIPFHFTWQMAWPIFTRFQVTDLGADNTWLSLITVANSLSAVASYPLWSRFAERYGSRRMLMVAALWLATAPALTALAPTIQWLVPVNLFTGAGVAGVTLLVLENLLEVSTAEERPVFLALHSALVSVSASIAPLVGAFLMSSLPIRTGLMLCTGFRVLTGAAFALQGSIRR
jgi:MFS family permease